MKKPILYMMSTAALAVMLSACSGNAGDSATPASTSEPTSQPSAVSTEPVQETGNENVKLPEHLPSDFPIPTDAVIDTSQSFQEDGKKGAMLILKSEQDMDGIVKMYKDYFDSLPLNDGVQTIDDRNIIIQGEDSAKGHSWSIIGGKLASSDDKIIELTITWSEL
ncbi:hypothetical protein ACX93W_08270 [Paenibacillus sp. CAU 1782]